MVTAIAITAIGLRLPLLLTGILVERFLECRPAAPSGQAHATQSR